MVCDKKGYFHVPAFTVDYECAEGQGGSECCEALLAGQEEIISGQKKLISGQEKIIQLLGKMTDCVCDCSNGGGTDETDEIIGVILPESGTKAGTSLYRVDKDIENVDSLPTGYFDNHKLWKGIVREQIGGQTMVKIPAFAYKRTEAQSGSNAGKRYLLLAPADTTEPGFERHPAFMKDGEPIDCFWVGAYQACVDPIDANKLASLVTGTPVLKTSKANMLQKIEARNTGGVDGFMMWSLYQLGAIQMLYLVEYADTDSQAAIGAGKIGGGLPTNGNDPAVASSNYRGIIALWGNAWQMLDGVRFDGSRNIELWQRDGVKNIGGPHCSDRQHRFLS